MIAEAVLSELYVCFGFRRGMCYQDIYWVCLVIILSTSFDEGCYSCDACD